MRKGVNEKEALSQATKLAEKYLYRQKLGETTADDPYFVRALDELGAAVLKLRKTPIVGKPISWFQMFVSTPVNVAKAMVARSPLGFIGGNYSKQQIVKASMGSMAMAYGALLAAQDKTTWLPPTDEKAKRLWYDSGKRPFSIKIGNKWRSSWYTIPFSLALMIPAAVKYYTEESKTSLTDSQLKKMANIMLGISRFIGSQSSLGNLSAFFRMVDGDTDYTLPSQIGYSMGQVIPLSSLQRWINTIIDPYYRKSKTAGETIKKSIIGLSSDLRPYLTSEGKPAKRDFINAFLPYDISTEKPQYNKQLNFRQQVIQGNAVVNVDKRERTQAKEYLQTGQSLEGIKPRNQAMAMYQILKSTPKEERKTKYLELAQNIDPQTEEELKVIIDLSKRGLSTRDMDLMLVPKEMRAASIIDRLKALDKKNRKKKYLQLVKEGIITPDIELVIARMLKK